MKQTDTTNLALFLDFDNVALGARDARQRFDIQLVLQRLLEKGKIIVKRAYADWSHHKEYLTDLHQAGIELIEIPAPQLSGKNSADIRLVVDAMDLCYGKEHLDTFVIVSGDSDFSPLVSKLRENGKAVIGVGVRNSSSHLLIVNCDEFIFYDDIYADRVSRQVDVIAEVPAEKRKLFGFLVETIQGLMRESRGVVQASLIKDTMKRKQPEFNEHKFGYSTFGDLLEEAMQYGLLEAQRDSRAGGTWVVLNLGKLAPRADAGRRSAGRAGRRRNGRGRRGEAAPGANDLHGAESGAEPAPLPAGAAPPPGGPAGAPEAEARAAASEGGGSRRSRGRRRGRRKEGAAAEGAPEAAGGAPAPAPASGSPRPAVTTFPARDTAAPLAGGAPAGAPRPAAESGADAEGARAAAKPRRRAARKAPAETADAAEAPAARKSGGRGRRDASRAAPRSTAGEAAAEGAGTARGGRGSPAAGGKPAARKKPRRHKPAGGGSEGEF